MRPHFDSIRSSLNQIGRELRDLVIAFMVISILVCVALALIVGSLLLWH